MITRIINITTAEEKNKNFYINHFTSKAKYISDAVDNEYHYIAIYLSDFFEEYMIHPP